MTDKTLAALIQSDPEKGLAAALELYGDCCAGILHRMLGSTQDAEDCLGTVFCKLWQTIGQYDPEKSSLKSWVCRITRNTAIDMLRKSGLEILPLDEELPDCSDSPEMLLQKKDTAELVQSAIDSLEEPDRTIFVRRYYYLEKLAVIANALSMTEKAVERRLSRGRARLREYLLKKGVDTQ